MCAIYRMCPAKALSWLCELKTISGDAAHPGLTAPDNYNQLWKPRQMFGEQERVWNFDDPSIRLERDARRNDTSIVVSTGTVSRVTYGP